MNAHLQLTHRGFWLAGLLAVCGLALLGALNASAHTNGCHSSYACPSDHHSYIWTDDTGARPAPARVSTLHNCEIQ